MAKQVKDIPAKESYPWDQWLNGESWRLVQGEDFPEKLSLKGMACQCHNTAARRKIKVQVRQRPEEVNGKAKQNVLYVKALVPKKTKPKKKAKAKAK